MPNETIETPLARRISHRRRTRLHADAIAERSHRGSTVDVGHLMILVLAQQHYLEALDDQIQEMHNEEIGRG